MLTDTHIMPISLLFAEDEICEIRAIGVSDKINAAWEGCANSGDVSGYFNDPNAFIRAASTLDEIGCTGVYVTANPVNPALLDGEVNRLKVQKTTTQDKDILCIRRLCINLDPVRPVEISSTAEELKAAEDLATRVALWLEQEMGFAKAIRACSGSGFHLLYRLDDLPNTPETHQLIVDTMAAIEAKFHNEQVSIDLTTVNPAWICKLYGTTGRKGDSTAERPHRKSFISRASPLR